MLAEAIPFLAMSLEEFETRGALLEVRVAWLSTTLWLVPAGRDVAALMREGVSRGRIWTAGELRNLMAVSPRTPKTVRTLAHTKLAVDGEISEVRPRRDRAEG